MGKRKFKGIAVIVIAVITCLFLFCNRSSDFYSVQYGQSDFRQVYLEEYSGDSSELQYYVDKGIDTVKCFTKGPINLSGENTVTYNVELQYAANDDSTVFKIFAADYISPDNSGGKVFVSESLDPQQSALKTSFELDQNVDTVFVLLETKDEDLQIGRVNVKSEDKVFSDTTLMMWLMAFLSFVMLIIINLKTKDNHYSIGQYIVNEEQVKTVMILLGIAAIFLSSLPILDSGIIAGHDTPFHMARIEGIARGLESGQFPVRIHGGLINDYGYPNSLFYPELLLYVPAFLNVVGLSVYTCYKIYIVMINIITLVCAYISFKKLSDNRMTGFVFAVVYLLLPYRAICAYYRSAIGEFTAMAFLPLVVYGLYAIVYGNKKDWGYLVAGATGVLQSHILSTEMTAVFAAIFVMLSVKRLFTKEKRFLYIIFAAVTTVMLNAWFLIPMLLMMLQLNLIVFTRAALTSQFASADISNMFSLTKLNFFGTHPFGLVTTMVLFAYPVFKVISGNKNDEDNSSADNMYINMLFFILASTALFPWGIVEQIPVIGTVLSSVQFPYRFTSISQLCSVFILCMMMYKVKISKNTKYIVNFILLIVVVVSSLSMTENIVGYDKEKIQNKSYYENSIDYQLSVGQAEYLIGGNNLDYMVAHPPVLESENETMSIENFAHWGTKMSFDYSMDLSAGNSDVIVLPVTYIPNYIIEINGQRVYPFKTLDARVAFNVPSETGSVTARYSEPLTFRACEMVSLVSLMAFIFISTPKGKQLLSKIKKN